MAKTTVAVKTNPPINPNNSVSHLLPGPVQDQLHRHPLVCPFWLADKLHHVNIFAPQPRAVSSDQNNIARCITALARHGKQGRVSEYDKVMPPIRAGIAEIFFFKEFPCQEKASHRKSQASKHRQNGSLQRLGHCPESFCCVDCAGGRSDHLEATPGIEPGYTDLQSAASPLRHVALFPDAE